MDSTENNLNQLRQELIRLLQECEDAYKLCQIIILLRHGCSSNQKLADNLEEMIDTVKEDMKARKIYPFDK